jgi:hypothetical protein
MGLGGDACRNLGEAQIDAIRTDMAIGYIDTLIDIASRSGGSVDRDVDYRETRDFHEQAFREHNLSLDNWTIHTPMEIVRQQHGDQAVEDLWQRIRETGGSGLDAIAASTGLMNIVGQAAFSPDPATSQAAQDWMDQVPGTANWDQIGRFIDIFGRTISSIWNDTWQSISDWVSGHFTNSQRSASPIMLDLDGDGLEITQFSGGSITFDHNADGVRTGTAWVGRDDGLLVWDRDGNGAIDSGRELFGNNTLLANGQTAADGWAALRDLDLNGDGVLDLADAAFAELRVWRDLDQDGTSDEGELFTLEALGITQIGLNKTNSTQTLADGTRLDGTGYFTINGQTQQYTDAWFAENPFYRQFATSIEVSEEVQIFPAFLGALSQQSSTRVVGREH